jgi:hypothetical protein
MAQAVWNLPFQLKQVRFTPAGNFEVLFLCAPGNTYTIEYTDSLQGTPVWHSFAANGTFTATGTSGRFEDDFTANTSGGPSSSGQRYYRFKYTAP